MKGGKTKDYSIKKRKAFLLFDALPTSEVKKYKKYLSSYLNEHNTLLRLVNFIEEEMPNYGGTSVNSETFYKHFYQRDTYNPTTLDTLFTNFQNSLYDFLALEAFRKDHKSMPRYAIKRITEVLPSFPIEKVKGDFDRKLKKLADHSAEYHLAKHDYLYQLFPLLKLQYGLLDPDYWLETYGELEHFFLTKYYEMLSGIQVFNHGEGTQITLPHAAYLNEYIEASFREQPLTLQIYYLFYVCHTCEDWRGQYPILKKLVIDNEKKVPREDYIGFFMGLLMLSIAKLNLGHRDFLSEANLLMHEGIEKKIFGFQSPTTYRLLKTIVVISCRAGEYEKAEAYYHRITKLVAHDEENRLSNLAYAILLLYKEAYSEGIRVLNKVRAKRFKDFQMGLDYRFYQMILYLERGEAGDFDLMGGLKEAFKKFVSRKMSWHGAKGKAYREMFKVLKEYQEILLKSPLKQLEALRKLKKKVEEVPPFSYKGLFFYLIGKRIKKLEGAFSQL